MSLTDRLRNDPPSKELMELAADCIEKPRQHTKNLRKALRDFMCRQVAQVREWSASNFTIRARAKAQIELLERLRRLDMMDACGDGPYRVAEKAGLQSTQ